MAVFRVEPEVFSAFPSARFAAVVVRGIDNSRASDDASRRLATAVAATRDAFAGVDAKSHPSIAAWREAFGARGWTPSKYLSSIEALVRRVARGDDLPSINPAVDLGNAASLRYLVPIGAHDLAAAPDGIAVRLARPDDRFLPMGDAPEESPDPGEIVYASGSDVRTRRWVWRQSRTALVTGAARDLLYPIDGFSGITEDAMRAAAAELAEVVPALLGGGAHVFFIDPEHPAAE
ncbi:MAG TPA: phenylalanine--tRNA ligase beta subunit-related protein [Thermomicrobiaceae bacterium]|nr:phenylalanine--tRNA ligase beta subunit-related protein [Thermomicrobiaceae bacterium]